MDETGYPTPSDQLPRPRLKEKAAAEEAEKAAAAAKAAEKAAAEKAANKFKGFRKL